MKVILLSPYPQRIIDTIKAARDEVECWHPDGSPPLPETFERFGFCVSYGWRQIIRPVPPIPTINLHISFLPWNRGADPNYWSWVDDTPKGVSIHWLDAGIDTGPVIIKAQTRMTAEVETLASSYDKLQKHIAYLFATSWCWIRALKPDMYAGFNNGQGSFHRKRDLPFSALDMDTPVRDLRRPQ